MTSLVAKPERCKCSLCGRRLVGLQARWIVEESGTVADLGVRRNTVLVPICDNGCKAANLKQND